jgi:hypothetical protein
MSGRTSARSRLGYPSLAKLLEAHKLLGPIGAATSLDPELKEDRQAADRAIADIVKDFRLHSLESELRSALQEAAEAYWAWRALNREQGCGLGERSDIDALERALGRAKQLLRKVTVRNRLQKAVESDPSSLSQSPANEVYYRYSDSIFESVRHARATISGLLVVTQFARGLDGREGVSRRRGDLSASIKVLASFWKGTAKRRGKVYSRGSTYSSAAKFQYACLRLIDPEVTLRLVVDLNP